MKKIFLLPLLSLAVIFTSVFLVNNQRLVVGKKAAEEGTKEFTQISSISAKNKKPTYRVTINGKITLQGETSYARIIMVDKKGEEYLIYEVSPLLASRSSVPLTNVCDETCLLDRVTPDFIKVEGYKAKVELAKINFTNSLQKVNSYLAEETILEERNKLLKQVELNKITEINRQIKANGMQWVAGETSVSKLTYAQKKKLFSTPDGKPVEKLPNLQGFEYYKGGIFEIKSDSVSPTPTPPPSQLPVSWDWRNVHGENWLTPVKSQGNCGSCWAFASTAAIEANLNLYFNQHLNFDLSEQELISCSGAGSCSGGAGEIVIENYVPNNGIVDEECFRYTESNVECNLCDNSEGRKISFERGQNLGALDEREIKETLKEKGVIYSVILSWYHAMALVGYAGRSDWKSLDRCEENELCLYDKGCVSRDCDDKESTVSVCSSNFHNPGEVQEGRLNTFSCSEKNRYLWDNTSICSDFDLCFEDKCQKKNTSDFYGGMKECSYDWDYTLNKPIGSGYYWEYSYGKGESYWVFKNSWGEDWGENGFARITIPFLDLISFSLPVSPMLLPADYAYWPPGFDGRIKCVDKDNDTYCNWGISEAKPASCPWLCEPQKDCDDSNSELGPFDENMNCTPTRISPTPVWKPCSFCDADKSGKVCRNDIEIMAKCFQQPIAGACTNFDLNSDKVINIFDLVRCASACFSCPQEN